jgi:predicted metalloprotease
MRWDRSHRSSWLEDRRASSGRGGMGGNLLGALALGSRFGWRGVVIALVVIAAIAYGGGTCSGLFGGGGTTQTQAPLPTETSERTPGRTSSTPAPRDELARFVGFVIDDVNQHWQQELPGYQPTRLVLFRGAIDSACGTASSAVGPFYCPIDRKAYVDLAFYGELRRRFGAPGDFAQAYVIAHELGHHVQNQRGLLGGGEVNQIEIELQADCLAGAWGRGAEARGLVEVGDVDEALTAAAQIGDDTIQRKTQGHVQPETWTHGSAAQRSSAFKRGYRGGAEACL